MGIYYGGIGSRKTPLEICNLMTDTARKLSEKGYILRSGGAIGADQAFEKGADNKEIYTPKNFENTKENLDFCERHLLPVVDKGRNFKNFRHETKLLLMRNVHQILGKPQDPQDCNQQTLKEVGPRVINVLPVSFVIFWIPIEDIWDPAAGGTKYAVRIAANLNIPLFNLKNEIIRKRIENWVYV